MGDDIQLKTQFRASHRYARMGARKARRVVDLIRGKAASDALDTLANDNHRASVYVRRVIASAVANALQQDPDVRANRLVVATAHVNEGPLLQGRLRFRPTSMGRSMPFRRRTCHIHVSVEERETAGGSRARRAKAKAAEATKAAEASGE